MDGDRGAQANHGGDALAGKRALVTGGLGFIGSNLARRLVALGARVTLVDSLWPDYGGNLFNIVDIADQVRVNISDVRDEHSLRYLIRDQDYLFNLAGQTSHLDSMSDPYTDLDINCRAQLSILEACRKHNPAIKVVFASTRQVYGTPRYLPVDENHLLRPVDVNGINKMAGEWYHVLYDQVYGVRACALRLTNTYGPRMRTKDARQTFLGVWVAHVVRDEPFEVWGGDQVRDFTYVDDAVTAFVDAAISDEVNGRIFNLGGAEPVTLGDLARTLIEAAGSGSFTVQPFPAERKRIDIGDYYADASLIRATTGWEPTTGLAEGLAATVEFHRRHRAHYE